MFWALIATPPSSAWIRSWYEGARNAIFILVQTHLVKRPLERQGWYQNWQTQKTTGMGGAGCDLAKNYSGSCPTAGLVNQKSSPFRLSVITICEERKYDTIPWKVQWFRTLNICSLVRQCNTFTS
jgi:hypothetical protein